MYFLFLLILLLNEVIFVIELLMEAGSDSRKLETFWDVSFFIATADFVFEHD